MSVAPSRSAVPLTRREVVTGAVTLAPGSHALRSLERSPAARGLAAVSDAL